MEEDMRGLRAWSQQTLQPHAPVVLTVALGPSGPNLTHVKFVYVKDARRAAVLLFVH